MPEGTLQWGHLRSSNALQEFTLLFTQLMDAMVEGDKPAIAHAALTFIFYW